MSRTGEEDEVPPRFNDENNTNNNQEDDKSRASKGPSLEDLMTRLEKLTIEKNKLRRKAKERRQRETLPQVKMRTPHLRRMSQEREERKKQSRQAFL
jgi:hypothetical protein